MTAVRYARGVTAASLAAGPLVALPPIAVGIVRGWAGSATELVTLPFVLILSVPFGFVLSLLPNAIGTALLARAGRGNIGLRFWPVWAMAGAGFGYGLDLLLAWANGLDAVPLFAWIGLPCALICRWGTRWDDGHGQARRHEPPTLPAGGR